MNHRVIPTPKTVAFVVRPPKGDVFTEPAVTALVGRTTIVQRLDRSSVEAEIVDARLDPDGSAVFQIAVPGGIDRAPTEEVVGAAG